ncbi:Endo-1,4-beta-xylanase 1 [Linum perenne]
MAKHLAFCTFIAMLIFPFLLPAFLLAAAHADGRSILGPYSHQHQTTLIAGVTAAASAVNDGNIVLNPRFEDGLKNWSAKGCMIELHESMDDGKILPQSGKYFVSATKRTEPWNGIEQEITGRVQRQVPYGVNAVARICGNNVTAAAAAVTLQLTLWVQEQDLRSLQATDKDWVQLQGEFLLNGLPSRAIIFFEGPPAGTDILINSLVVQHAPKLPSSSRPVFQDPPFSVNVVDNSNLEDGTTSSWFPLGNCILSVESGSPYILPPMAKDSLGTHESLSGRYIRVTNRSESWMGPAQIVTDKLKLYLTYQVSAWVRIGPGANSSQIVNAALGVDGDWINGGEVEVNDGNWHEIGGTFRLEKQPSNAMVYVQGPDSGVDLMVAGLHIFGVNRKARFSYLKKQTDKIRKRDVILKFPASGLNNSTYVKVKQTQNSFAWGSCISRTSLDNDKFVKFLLDNFNWVVFGNEMKWSWTEPEQGKFNYKEADEMLEFCTTHNLKVRGHCIFWEVESRIQSWVTSLNQTSLTNAVHSRLNDLLTRFKGKFSHYDVNNEMLHGSFYQDRLGYDIRANMFKTAHQLDPSATLFVNDYHIEDASDVHSTPELYARQVLDLREQGAKVGGIGVQGHIEVPVGTIVSSALDKLATLGIPIWLTELDVSSVNEFIRADDLEVMLREAFAHPAVEGVVLWGFWELYMSRKNAHLVDVSGKINQAGKRFLSLKKEWMSEANGSINEKGEFKFRGFHGTYDVQFVTLSHTINTIIVVDKGNSPLVVAINT